MKSGNEISPVFFFLRISLAIQSLCGLLYFHINFRSAFFTSKKYAIRILIEIALNLWMTFGDTAILTLILPIHEQDTFPFICLCWFTSSMSCNFRVEIFCLLEFIPKYFIVFDATVNGIDFFLYQKIHS